VDSSNSKEVFMADWLKKVVEETNRQFEELPEWKKAAEQTTNCSTQEQASSTIREPNAQDK
jgi:hypothetical protein